MRGFINIMYERPVVFKLSIICILFIKKDCAEKADLGVTLIIPSGQPVFNTYI